MGDLASWSERRSALRAAVRGVAVFHAEAGTLHGTIENLSRTGALVSVHGVPTTELHDVEIRLGGETGWVTARTVRVERGGRRLRIALAFERVDGPLAEVIENAIDHALRAAQRRPVLVIDESRGRRSELATKLAARGMTPLVPRTPLEAIDLLTRAQLHVNVILFAPSFGHSGDDLRALVSDSFPWVSAAEISDDLEATVDRALEAWSATDGARLARAIA